MTVSEEYAKANFGTLLEAVKQGEAVDIADGDKPVARIMPVNGDVEEEQARVVRPRSELLGAGVRPRSEIFGAGGGVFFSDDWDSPETNAEIADLFNNSPLFHEPTGEP